MKKYFGGEKVQRGVYVNMATWEITQLHKEPAVLPGTGELAYIKAPAPLMITLGPIAGLAFVIFLPFVGILGAASFIGYKLNAAGQGVARRVVHPVAFGWKPGTAYLAKRGPVPEAKGEDLTELEDTVKALRDKGTE